MRLIDADIALENIDEWLDTVGTALIGWGLSYYAELQGCIEDAPTVDAVPVVRCKDCKYHRGLNEEERKNLLPDVLICTNAVFADSGWNPVLPNDFCSCGERR